MTLRSFFSEARIDSNSAIASRTDFNSLEISSIESLVKRCSCSSRMASACFEVNGLSASSFGARPGGVDVDLLAAEVRDQIFASIGAIGAAADDHDHVVEVIERGQVAFQNVLAIARFVQQIRSAAAHDIDAMVDEVFDRLDQPHFLGLSVDDGQQNHAEAFLHRGVLEELVEHDLRFGAALELDHDAHAVAIAFVANVGDVVDGLLIDQVGDALDQARLIHLVKGISVTMIACLSLVTFSMAARARIMKRPRPVR